MHRTARRLTTTLAAVALTLGGLAACGGDPEQKAADKAAEKALEDHTGEDVDVDSDGDDVTVDTGDGTTSVGEDVALPEQFPDSIPMPSVEHSIYAATTQGDEMAVLMNLTDVDVEAEKDHLVSGLEAGGWSVEEPFTNVTTDTAQLMLTATTDGWGLQIVVNNISGESTAAYTLSAGD